MHIFKKEPWKTIFRIILIVSVYAAILYVSFESRYGSLFWTNIMRAIFILTVVVFLIYYSKKKANVSAEKDTNDNKTVYETGEFEEKLGIVKKELKWIVMYFIATIILVIINMDLDYLYIFIYISMSLIALTLMPYDDQRTKLYIWKVGIIRGLIYAFTVLPLMALITWLIIVKHV